MEPVLSQCWITFLFPSLVSSLFLSADWSTTAISPCIFCHLKGRRLPLALCPSSCCGLLFLLHFIKMSDQVGCPHSVYISTTCLPWVLSSSSVRSLPVVLSSLSTAVTSFFFNKFIYFNWRLITLQYCSSFAVQWHESATGVHVFPILNPPPSPAVTCLRLEASGCFLVIISLDSISRFKHHWLFISLLASMILVLSDLPSPLWSSSSPLSLFLLAVL